MNARITSSASRSNCVTGDPSDLRSALSRSLRKPDRINSVGARAASTASFSKVGSISSIGSSLQVQRALRQYASPERAVGVARFFKTGKGQYGEGDVFIGVTVPEQRRVARQFRTLPLAEADTLLTSKVHEDRLTALLILADQFTAASGDTATQRRIFRLYMKRLPRINNWDLVDTSADPIVGGWLATQGGAKDRMLLERLALSKHLWSRRIAMIATFYQIKRGSADDALRIAARLL